MKIVVCVKEVVHLYGRIGSDLENILDGGNTVRLLNDYDLFAVEEAIRIKENRGGEVIVISLGPSTSEAVLRECLAMGADRAIRIDDSVVGDSDSYAKSVALSKAINKLTYDLIFFGKEAIDTDGGEVGGMVAGHLDIPLVTAVIKFELSQEGTSAKLYRCLEKGAREIVQCPFPAVITVEKGINRPRYPAHRNRLWAEKEVVSVWDDKMIGLEESTFALSETKTRVLKLSPPRPRTRKIFVPESDLSPEERLNLLMSGGIVEKADTSVLEGSPEEIASKVVQFFVDNKIIEDLNKGES